MADSGTDSNTGKGNTQVLKLLIKYIKKRGKNAKIYDSKHHVSCCMNFHLMWNFYMLTDCGRKMIDAILTNYHCKVSLSADGIFKESFIFQVLNAKFKEESYVHHFVDGVLDSVYVCAQKSLSIDSIEIDPRIQEDVRERIKERKELDCAWIEFVGEDKPIKVYTVCCKDQKQFVMQIITEVITDVTKSFNSHKEMVTADFMWQTVMTRFEYLKETGLKFPSTEIINDKNQNAFLLKGPRDEVKAAAGHLEELLKMAHEEVYEEVFSPGYQFEIFAFSEMCDYIDNSLPKLAIVWIPNNLTKTLHLFSKDPEQLKGIDKFIKGCIKESLYPLSKDNSNLPSEKIYLLEELKKKQKGRIVINLLESPIGLLVTTADDIFGIVDAAMQTIISSEIGEIHPETYVPEKPDGRDGQPDCNSEFSATNSDVEKNNLSSDISDSGKNIARSLEVKDDSVFRKLLIEHMEKFNQIAKEHCVSIEVSETQSRVGFVLKGLEEEVRHVVEIIRSTAKQQMQLQQDIRDTDGAAEKIHKHTTLCPNAAGKPENSKMSDMVTEDETPIPPPRAKRMKSSATENAGLHEGVEDAKAEEPGLEQRVWSYPNGKKITLLKATSCDANVIIIPGNNDQDSQSHSGDKNLMRLKVPDGSEMKAKTVLQQEIKEVLDRILEKTVGICIKTMEGWNFLRYLKCFLYEIYKCFIRNEGMPCPIECVILLVDDASDYNNARKIIQKSFKLEQDKSEVFASQRVLLQEQGSVFKRIRVQVQKGQLHEAKVEVLVNTVDRSLDLTKGVISSSLLDKAGDGIQRELQQYQGNFVFGEVLKTGAGTLPKPCMAILHGVLYVYEGHSDCLKVFQDFLAGCLEEANKKYRSIAFPPIGTGKLHYPKDLVASLMFQSVAKFEKAHPTCKLEEVIFVIYEKDQETLKVFEELYRRYVETTVADQLEAMPSVSGVSRMLPYGQVQVQAKLGDFENENQNCLLVLWEKQCLYNISEKNHILHSAGSTVIQKWREHRNTKQFYRDVVMVTPGGNLRYEEIIHVASDINNIKKAAKAGLIKADIEKMKTVVVPVTKDDSFLRDTNKFCGGILKAINELATKLKCVQSVTLVIQGQHNFPFFNEVFEKESRVCGTEIKTDALFEKEKEICATDPQAASLSSSEKVVPIAITEKIKDPSTAVDVSASSSQKKTVVKEPVSPDITEADRSGGKDPGPLKAIFPGQEKHKSTVLQYSSEEQCSFLVCDVKQEDVRRLEEQIKSFDSTVKLVYPYKVGEALVICKNSEDKNTLVNKLEQYKVQSVGPQKIQGLTAVGPQTRKKVRKVKKKQDPDKVEQQSEVTISHTQSSVQFKALPSQQQETSEIKEKKRSPENSLSGDFENTEQIMNVSQSDFLALQSLKIYFEWTHKFNIKFTHEKETLYVQGALSDLSEEMKKEIEKEIAALRGKQKTELPYDPQEIMQFRSAVDEAKSDQLLLVWDDDNKQVLVYSDGFEDIQKFKHKVEFKMGKKKPTSRSGRRFANQEYTMPLLSDEETPVEKKITRSFSWSQEATNVEVFKTLEGIVVKVYEANILRLDVDCIVNAANDNLQHGGGVALVIAKGAGPEIDREGSEILKVRGRIKVGEQCVTTAGNLPYGCIIHTVGPRWSDYYPHDARNTARCETDLFNSIIGCFFEAENRNLKSIALPAISSGIFAVPRDMCTEQYAKAVIHYSKTRTSQVLQEIHFIDMLPGIVKDMQLAFKRHLSCDGNAKHIVKDGDQTTAINDLVRRDSGKNHGKRPEKNIGETYPKDEGQTKEKQNHAEPLWPEIEQKYFKKEKFYIYKPNNKIEVNIYMADITKLTGMQVITCSDDRRGNGHGAIASALLKTGNSKYTSIKKKAFEKEVHFGDVIITEGGDSNFHMVAHAVLPFKDPISSERHKEMVHKCYDRILDEINKWQKTSLALPLLGAGYAELGYEGSAKLFLDSLEVFCNRTTKFNLKVIHIVDRDEHIIQKIADVFIKHTERVRNDLLAANGRELKQTLDLSSQASSVRPREEISQVHNTQENHAQQSTPWENNLFVSEEPTYYTLEAPSSLRDPTQNNQITPSANVLSAVTQGKKTHESIKERNYNDVSLYQDSCNYEQMNSCQMTTHTVISSQEKQQPLLSPPTPIVSTTTNATHSSPRKSPRKPMAAQESPALGTSSPGVKPKIPMSGEQSKEECLICLAEMISLKKLSCGHTFCIKCIEKQFRTKPVCPKCGTFHGTIYGDQPKGGKMSISIQKQSLPGFVKTDTLIIEYQIPSGTQGPNHPKPGMKYSGIIRTAYLPDTTEGRKVCDLLKVAFERRLIFKISRSTTKGVDYILTWNNIHHKTKLSGKYGYPDPGYLKRVQDQLAAKGVTEADLEQGTLV